MNKNLIVNWKDIFIPTASIAETIVRGSLVYLMLFVLVRLVVKRRVGGIGVTNLLVMVMLADAVQNAMASELKSVVDGLILVCTILVWNYALDWLGYHIPAVQYLLRAPALPLVRDGQLLRDNMQRELVTLDELMNQLREQGLKDLSEIKEACLEGDGHISVIRRDHKEVEGGVAESLPI